MVNFIIAIVSFSLGLFISSLIRYFKKYKKKKREPTYKKVKLLSHQDFKKTMKNLEIK